VVQVKEEVLPMKAKQWVALTPVLFLCVAGPLACQGNSPSPLCAAGATQTCVCPNGLSGAQVCEVSGAMWGQCVCQVQKGEAAKPDIPAESVRPPTTTPGTAGTATEGQAVLPQESRLKSTPAPATTKEQDAIYYHVTSILKSARRVDLAGTVPSIGPLLVFYESIERNGATAINAGKRREFISAMHQVFVSFSKMRTQGQIAAIKYISGAPPLSTDVAEFLLLINKMSILADETIKKRSRTGKNRVAALELSLGVSFDFTSMDIYSFSIGSMSSRARDAALSTLASAFPGSTADQRQKAFESIYPYLLDIPIHPPEKKNDGRTWSDIIVQEKRMRDVLGELGVALADMMLEGESFGGAN